jgi:hypothetical protein
MTESVASAEAVELAFKVGGALIAIGGALAGLRESLRLGKASHRRMDDHDKAFQASEVDRARHDAIMTTKIDGQVHELERVREALHQTRNEIGSRLGRIEDRLDVVKGHA